MITLLLCQTTIHWASSTMGQTVGSTSSLNKRPGEHGQVVQGQTKGTCWTTMSITNARRAASTRGETRLEAGHAATEGEHLRGRIPGVDRQLLEPALV